MNTILNVLRGADPELFLITSEGTPVTSIGLVGGTKKEPRSIGGGYAVQEDNVAVEFNIPPASDKTSFVNSIQHVLGYLEHEMSKKGLLLDISATREFEFHDLLHPQARELGCEPDYNAWTLRPNPRPEAPDTLRSSGGHIHIGYDNPNDKSSIMIVKAHDLFCGLPSLDLDSDTLRRSIYGKAGAHRIKTYGVEYRTLSNFWIKSPELMEFIYEQSEKAINWINAGGEISKEWGDKIVSAINNGDRALQKEVQSHFAVC